MWRYENDCRVVVRAIGLAFERSVDFNLLDPFVLIGAIDPPVEDNQGTGLTAVISHIAVHELHKLACNSDCFDTEGISYPVGGIIVYQTRTLSE